MPIPLDSLLAPISPSNPCGDDVSYDPAFQELETLILGKPETQFSPAEPPDWALIQKSCVELLGRSKHLRIAMTLTAALLRTEGIPGFRDGFALVAGLIENYWEPVYPRLDPDDDNDPTERLNIIGALATPLSQQGDSFRFLEGLRAATLSSSPQMGRFSLEDVARVQAGPAEGTGPNAAQIEASFRDTPPAVIERLAAIIVEMLGAIKNLKTKIGELAGENRIPDFDDLIRTFREMQKSIAPFLGAPAPTDGAGQDDASAALDALVADGGASSVSSVSRGAALSGSIESREDVVRALDLICSYYARREPSSPIPLLLERAKRLVQLDFMAIIGDFAPDALGQVQMIAGVRPS